LTVGTATDSSHAVYDTNLHPCLALQVSLGALDLALCFHQCAIDLLLRFTLGLSCKTRSLNAGAR
jgi:hypothetical protein